VVHGDLDSEARRLTAWQNAGAGVFVTVNATDGMGRKAENVVKARAAFVDLDGVPLDPVMECSLEPHIIVESSPERWHCYWTVSDLPLDQFELVQKAIAAKFNGDPTVHDLPRVMRMVGYWHQKGAPFLSRIVQVNERLPYPAREILEAFPPLKTKPKMNGAAADHEATETAELVRRVLTGEQYHDAIRDLAWRFFRRGMPASEIITTLRGMLEAAVPEKQRDDRWRARYAEIARTVETAVKKQQPEAEAGETFEQAVERLAKLKPAEYDRARKAEADRLGVRVGTLDHDVAAARPAPAADEESGKGKALDLSEPEPWGGPVDGAELVAGLVAQIRRFVILSDHAAVGAALWVLHAHAHDAAFHSPRLTLTSPTMRCGKSTMLRTIGRLIPRPLPTANITPAATFRVIEAAKPALLIDEADTFAQDNEELRGVINSSHCCLDAFVIRTVAIGDDFEARRFSTWAPMAIASIGKVATTIADRSIMIRMERKPRGVKVARMRVDRDDGFSELASKAARWTADHMDALRRADPEMPRTLNDRAADNWRLLLGIAVLCGGDWRQKARAAALALSSIDEDADTIGVMLLGDIKTVFASTKAESIWTEDLLHHLHAMSAQPWSEYGRLRKPITPRQLASLLKPFAINVRQIWKPEAKANKQGYAAEQFESAWNSYLSPSPLEAPDSAAFSDFSSPSDEEPLGDRNPPKATATAGSRSLGDSEPSRAGSEGNGLGSCAHCGEQIDLAGAHTATSAGEFLHNRCIDEWSKSS
jgi:putative DNA primase/helicase